jgi:hypothetical protein
MKEERRKEDKEKTRYALGTKEGEQESSTSTTKTSRKTPPENKEESWK